MDTAVLNSVHEKEGAGTAVAPDVLCLKTLIVNVCLVGKPGAGEWVLVDAGLLASLDPIRRAAGERFGPGAPRGIVLTHGHFDHVGALDPLLAQWDVPVYAHERELPYLTGKADYPPADPGAAEGLLARVSPLYPHHGIDLGDRVQALPADGSIPPLPGWRWIATPGHTPGHISLFRESDRILIAGDAITTVRQESALAVLTQAEELHGPPAYFTPDWREAGESIRRIEALSPSVVISGHGQPMERERLSRELAALAGEFERQALPWQGR